MTKVEIAGIQGESHQIKVNGIMLHYTQCGVGDPLILLHGNGEDQRIFAPLMAKLAKYFTVYALDSRNHGQSEKTDQYHYSLMMQDTDAFIDALCLEKVNMLGFSDGSIITMLLALTAPEKLDRLMLLGPNLQPSDLTESCLRYMRMVYRQTADPLYKMMLEEPNILLGDLAKIPHRTLVFGGENDLYKPMTLENISAALPNGTLKIIKDHDHGSYIVNNDLIFDDLLTFLQAS